jgi:hypothetical protein
MNATKAAQPKRLQVNECSTTNAAQVNEGGTTKAARQSSATSTTK